MCAARVDSEARAAMRAEAAVAAPDPIETIAPAAISSLFGKGPNWFSQTRVRDKLEAAGFPPPVSRGKWRKRAVVFFFLEWSAGMRANGGARPRRRVRRR